MRLVKVPAPPKVPLALIVRSPPEPRMICFPLGMLKVPEIVKRLAILKLLWAVIVAPVLMVRLLNLVVSAASGVVRSLLWPLVPSTTVLVSYVNVPALESQLPETVIVAEELVASRVPLTVKFTQEML